MKFGFLSLILLFFLHFAGFSDSQALRLAETLLFQGQYRHTLFYLSSLPETDIHGSFYRGISYYCMGEFKRGFGLISKNAEASSEAVRKNGASILLSWYLKQDELPESFKDICDLFKKEVNSTDGWRVLILEQKLKDGHTGEVVQSSPVLYSARHMKTVYEAYVKEGQEQLFFEKFLKGTYENKLLFSELLKLAYAKGYKEQALNAFHPYKSVKSHWVSDLYLYFGNEEKNKEWQNSGYKILYALDPLNINVLRDYAAFLYKNQKESEADKLLLDRLKSSAGSVSMARSIASILLDNHKVGRLMEFIRKLREESSNPYLLSESMLYALSYKKDYKGFFQELEKRYSGASVLVFKNLLEKNFEGFQLKDVLKQYCEEKPQSSCISLMTSLYSSLPESDREWWNLKMEKASSNISADQMIMKAGSYNPDAVLALYDLFSSSNRAPGDDAALLVADAAYSTGKHDRAWKVLYELQKKQWFSDTRHGIRLIDLAHRMGGKAREIQRWYELLAKQVEYKDGIVPEKMLRSLHYQVGFAAVINGDEPLYEKVKSLPMDKEAAEALNIYHDFVAMDMGEATRQMKTWLHNRSRSPYFVEIAVLYSFLLDTMPWWKEEIFKLWHQCWIAMQSGDLNKVPQIIAKAEEHSTHVAMPVFEKEFRAFSILWNQKKMDSSLKYRTDWEEQTLSYVEKYPDDYSAFTFAMKMVEVYKSEGETEKLMSFVRKLLKVHPSSLIAQRLRASIL